MNYSKEIQFESFSNDSFSLFEVEKADKMKLNHQSVRTVQRFADQIHCVIYVISAESSLCPLKPNAPLNMVKEIRQSRKGIFVSVLHY